MCFFNNNGDDKKIVDEACKQIYLYLEKKTENLDYFNFSEIIFF